MVLNLPIGPYERDCLVRTWCFLPISMLHKSRRRRAHQMRESHSIIFISQRDLISEALEFWNRGAKDRSSFIKLERFVCINDFEFLSWNCNIFSYKNLTDYIDQHVQLQQQSLYILLGKKEKFSTTEHQFIQHFGHSINLNIVIHFGSSSTLFVKHYHE